MLDFPVLSAGLQLLVCLYRVADGYLVEGPLPLATVFELNYIQGYAIVPAGQAIDRHQSTDEEDKLRTHFLLSDLIDLAIGEINADGVVLFSNR